ncbi:hypothetical protein G7085_02485 [Tessaracoccus sp. HDW20]|nr:N,N-dimethylformamidase beta subunit family domain-containing protein [Tessaracoccus coleopterorum]NHB83922.1 hypothetical protein [Tessaracoccus coleopterorum]
MYFSKLTDGKGRERYIATVLRSTSFAGKVTVMSATFTHAAYNTTGGYSLYLGGNPMHVGERAYTVSLERPEHNNGADKIFRYELGLIQYLESLGVPLAYTTNADLHAGADRFAGSPAMVTLGHDEYWTVPMRANLEKLRDRGTNLIFLGSNTMFYRTRWDGTSLVTSYKLSKLDPVQTKESTGTFRSEPFPNPEARILGSQYDCDGANPQTDLVIVNPDFWAFAGTGAKVGSRYPKLVGHEVDKAGPDSPKSVHIAAHSSFQCTTRMGTSDITYYVAPPGWRPQPRHDGLRLRPQPRHHLSRGFGGICEEGDLQHHHRRGGRATRAAAHGPANYEAVYPSDKPVSPAPVDIYITPGYHDVNGRRWQTTCEKYSATERCRTDIFATTVKQQGSRFVASNEWVLNNLTYKAMPPTKWSGNPLGNTGQWTSAEGRRWKTDCDTAVTGRNGCRSYIWSEAVTSYLTPSGNRAYRWEFAWRLNNMVRFS